MTKAEYSKAKLVNYIKVYQFMCIFHALLTNSKLFCRYSVKLCELGFEFAYFSYLPYTSTLHYLFF